MALGLLTCPEFSACLFCCLYSVRSILQNQDLSHPLVTIAIAEWQYSSVLSILTFNCQRTKWVAGCEGFCSVMSANGAGGLLDSSWQQRSRDGSDCSPSVLHAFDPEAMPVYTHRLLALSSQAGLIQTRNFQSPEPGLIELKEMASLLPCSMETAAQGISSLLKKSWVWVSGCNPSIWR